MNKQNTIFALVGIALLFVAWKSKSKSKTRVEIDDPQGSFDDMPATPAAPIAATTTEQIKYLAGRFPTWGGALQKMAAPEVNDVYTYITQYVDKKISIDDVRGSAAVRLSKAIKYITKAYGLKIN